MTREIAIIIMVFNVFIASFSQILLKGAANQDHGSKIKELLNFKVILSYAIFFCITAINVFAYRYVEFNAILVIEALSYISVMVLSWVFFKERLNVKQRWGVFLILIGVVIYSL